MRQFESAGDGSVKPVVPDSHMGIVVSEEDFEWFCVNHKTWHWKADEYLDYLDAEAAVVETLHSMGGATFLVPFEVGDYLEYCHDRGLRPDSDTTRGDYFAWLSTDEGTDAWTATLPEWVSKFVAQVDVYDELDARGLDMEDLADATDPIVRAITDTWHPLFGYGDHTVAVLTGRDDDTPTVVHAASSYPGCAAVQVWEDSVDALNDAVGQAWLWGGTILASRYDEDGEVSRIAWQMDEYAFRQMTVDEVAQRFGVRNEVDALVRRSQFESAYLCVASDVGTFDSEYVLDQRDGPIYEMPDNVVVADTLRALGEHVFITVTELTDPLTRARTTCAWDSENSDLIPLDAGEAYSALHNEDDGNVTYLDGWDA